MNQKQFYKTRAWRKARKEYIDRRKSIDGGLCETCGVELGYIVHHKIWLNDINCNDPAISLNPAFMKYDCLTCHNKEVDPNERIPGRVRYGPDGEIINAGDY